MNYSEVPELSSVYLEDSYVMSIETGPDTLTFELEVVLTENHPNYHEPASGEQYCYVKGVLVFRRIAGVEWVSQDFRTYTDAAGEEDLGNIDSLVKENGRWRAVGDWGEVVITTDASPALVLDI